MGKFDSPWDFWGEYLDSNKKRRAECRWPGCSRVSQGKGLCARDLQRAHRLGNLENPWVEWNAPHVCEWCNSEFKASRTGVRHCSKQCENRAYVERNEEAVKAYRREYLARHPEVFRDSNRRRRAQKRATAVERFSTTDVRLAYGDSCYLCSRPINFSLKYPHPQSPSLDHVIPLSRGGTHTLENAAMVHLACNFEKGVRDAPSRPQQTLLAI